MTINAQRENEVSTRYKWWDESEIKVASAMASVASNIERWNFSRRFLNLTCTRYMTGREMASQYSYSMARRPTQLARAYSRAEWRAPSFNVIANCADVYSSRIWKNRPFVQVLPIAGNFKARIRSKKQTRFADAVFADANLWDKAEDCGLDCMTVGDTFIKTHQDFTDENKIALTRIFADEVLVNEEEAALGFPRSIILRVFEHREVLMARYGDTAARRDAIARAPGVYSGLYFGNNELNTNDVLPVLEGYHLPNPSGGNSLKDAGRRVFSVSDVTLDDDKWTRPRFPLSQMHFSRHPTVGFFRKGLAESLLAIQQEIDRADGAIWESMRRAGWPRWLIEKNSQVEPGDLAGRSAGLVYYMQTAPQMIAPPVMPPDVYQKRNQWVQEAFKTARINPETAAGEHPEGLSSGTAIMAAATIDDAAHSDLGQRFEDFITDIANNVFDLAEEIKPKVRMPGRFVQEIKWDDVAASRNSYSMRAFPMSRLPQLPAARLQTIQNWYDQGIVDKATKLRLEQVPDTQGYMDLATASRDNIEWMLDNIIESGEYLPPEPYQDLKLALEVAQSRYLQERNEGTPEERLRLVQQWIGQVMDRIDENPPAPVGIQSPPGIPAVPGSQGAPPVAMAA